MNRRGNIDGRQQITMWSRYHSPVTIDEALDLLSKYRQEARIIAGGTDLILEIERGIRSPSIIIDVSRIPGLDEIKQGSDGWIHLGPLVTHNQIVASTLCSIYAYPLACACWQLGSPQIRNRATVAGNLITASPANDTITPLWALGATVTLRNRHGKRILSFEDFFQGVRKTALAEDEILVDVAFPPMATKQRGFFLKLGLRRAQAIAVVNVAVVLALESETVTQARIALGSVAPTIVRAYQAESFLEGKCLDDETMEKAAELAPEAAHPIDDIRGTADYRRRMVQAFTLRALRRIQEGTERNNWPHSPAFLWGKSNGQFPSNLKTTAYHDEHHSTPIQTTVNGKQHTIHGANHKTLLRMLREDLGLTGTKEGCDEGECGACTVWLDGIAVDSCLVPAPRAHGSSIQTIEGLITEERLHPVQQAFITESAVQCGYCTPGFVMSAASLLAENPQPDRETIKHSLTGCLCRCTGYSKILSAIERVVE